MLQKTAQFNTLLKEYNQQLYNLLLQEGININLYDELIKTSSPKILITPTRKFFNLIFHQYVIHHAENIYSENFAEILGEELLIELKSQNEKKIFFFHFNFRGILLIVKGFLTDEGYYLLEIKPQSFKQGEDLEYYTTNYGSEAKVVFDKDSFEIIDYNKLFADVFDLKGSHNFSDLLIEHSLYDVLKWLNNLSRFSDKISFIGFKHLTSEGTKQFVGQAIEINEENTKHKNVILLRFYQTSEDDYDKMRKLRITDSLYKIIEYVDDPAMVLNVNSFQVLTMNRAFLLLTNEVGKTPSLNQNFFELYSEVIDHAVYEDILYAINEKKSIRKKNIRLDVNSKFRKHTYYFDYEFIPFVDFEGNVETLFVVLKDVTNKFIDKKNLFKIHQFNISDSPKDFLGEFNVDFINQKCTISERGLQILNLTPDFIPPLDFFQKQLHSDDYNKVIEMYKFSDKNDDEMVWELRYNNPLGDIQWISFKVRLKMNNFGELINFQGFFKDVTNTINLKENSLNNVATSDLIKQKNTLIDQHELRFNNFVEDVDDYVIILLDINGYVMSWNKGLSKIFNYKEEEIVGANMSVFFTKEEIEDEIPKKNRQYAVKHGKLTEHSWRVKNDGELIWVASVLNPIRNEDGEVIYFTNVVKDLTQSMLAEQQMKEYLYELENRNKELEQFAYIASHDLQEPVRKIITFADMFQKDFEKFGADVNPLFLNKIVTSAKRMSNLINGILDYSRVSSSSQQIEVVDLNELIHSVLEDFEQVITDKKAIFKIDAFPEIRGFKVQLKQLFSNLISNSLKFTTNNPEITIQARKIIAKENFLNNNLDFVEIKFSDNGIGFNSEYKTKVFDMFQRLHDKNQYQGTGIGLSICKKIVDNHGGKITVDSIQNKGTTFTILLPIEEK